MVKHNRELSVLAVDFRNPVRIEIEPPAQRWRHSVPKPDTAAIERVFREEYGRAVAILVRHFKDLDLAEDAVQDAFTKAVARWPTSGIPPSPAGWIVTTARNRLVDRLRREAGADSAAQVDIAFRLAVGRPPSPSEKELAIAFLKTQSLKEFALAIFNLNAFLYVN